MNPIYLAFYFDSETKGLIADLLNRKNLLNKTMSYYTDYKNHCTWVIISELRISQENFLRELEQIMKDDTKYYGKLY